MDISKSRKSEERSSRSSIGSSILKPHKPRQPLQDVDFDFSLDENSPTAVSPTTVSPKLKRRVSFAEKKHVKEFCHLTDQGLTVWDSTYEEHDISHKGFNDTEEGSMILNKESLSKISNMSDVFLEVSRSETLDNNIVLYRNSDGKKNCVSNIGEKYCSESCFNNTKSELDKTCIKDISMEFTTAIPTSLAISSIKEHIVKNSDTSLDNSHSTNYCNVSMEITEALPASMESASYNLGSFEQMTAMAPNYKNAKHGVTNNTCDDIIFPINTESSTVSKSIIFDRKEDVNYFNDSMALTTVVQSTNTYCRNDIASNTSMEITAAITSKIHAEDIRHADETKFFNDVSIEMTRPVNMCTPSYNKENLRTIESRSGNDRTAFFNTSVEMTEMVSKNREVANLVTSDIIKSIFHKNMQEEKDKSTEFTVKNTTDFQSNLGDSINDISECDFLSKSLRYSKNSSAELECIEPPLFVCLDSEEETSFHTLHQDKPQTLRTADYALDNKNTIDFQSNLEDSINDISECNFLSKSLPYSKNSSAELECIESPLFVCLDSEEENSFHTLHQDKPQTLRTADDALDNNRYNNSDQSTNNKIEFVNPKTEVLINNQNNQAKDYYESITANKTENNQEADCHKRTKEARIKKGKYSPKRINNDEKLENNVEEKWQKDLNMKKSMEVKQYIDTLNKTEVLIKDTEKYCKENSNAIQTMEREEECIEKRPETEQNVGLIEDEFVINQNSFLSLFQRLEIHGNSDYCIWNVYHKNIDRKIITFGFMANSLLIVMYLSNINCTEEILKIQKITIIPRITDDSGVLIKIVHKLILEKLNAKTLMDFCKTQEDILPMLDLVSQDITLVMNFMFDLKRLNNLNLMEINTDEITFTSGSKHMDIIVKITIKVKRFDKLTSNDINVHCLLGTVREEQVRNLIKNIKKDYKFLTRYMNDVKSYLDIVEDTLK